MYITQDSDVVKGISRIPLSFTRLTEEIFENIGSIVGRCASNEFMLPELDDTDKLNEAFSSLALQRGEISPVRTGK